jgi:hypothetical protein
MDLSSLMGGDGGGGGLFGGMGGGGSSGDTSKEFGRSSASTVLGNTTINRGSNSPAWLPWAILGGCGIVMVGLVLFFIRK